MKLELTQEQLRIVEEELRYSDERGFNIMPVSVSTIKKMLAAYRTLYSNHTISHDGNA